jgi:tetratricopeptide (TPR) repeat protein
MELVRGIPLTDYCDREQLAIPERLELFVLVCRAVQHAHQKGIIHRDLKPSNILVTVIDGAAVPKIIDFGVAKATGASLTDRTVYTAFHQFVGTPLYMSPEQLDLAGMDMDTRSDIYSLGVLLYELLTGTTPFDQQRLRQAAFDELRRIIRDEEPPRPSTRLSTLGATRSTISANRRADARQLDRTVRGELDWIVMKALEKDRRRRYETASAFAADLMRHLTHQPVEACPPSGWYRFAKYARRNRGVLTTSAVVGLALVAGTAVATWQAIRATRASRVAREQRELAGKREKVAEDAAAAASRAAAESKAVLTFMVQDMLGASAPQQALGVDVKVPEGLAKGRETKVVEVLANAEKKIDTAFPDQPLVEAGVRYAMGTTYGALDQRDLAERHLTRSYELRRDLLGPDHPETLASMDRLLWTFSALGKHDEFRKLAGQTLEISRRTLGPEHPITLHSMSALAELRKAAGKSNEAQIMFEEILEIRRRVLGPEHPDTLIAMLNVAESRSGAGKANEAQTMYEQVLEIQRRVLGPDHPRILWTVNALGDVLQRQGKLDEARKLIEQTLEIRRRILAPEHPDAVWMMLKLVNVLRAQGNLEEARMLSEKTLEIGLRTPGLRHSRYFLSLHVEFLNAQGRHDEVRKLWEEVCKLYEQDVEAKRGTLGPEHPDTLAAMHELGDAFLEVGKVNEARALRDEILEIQRRNLGQDHPDTLNTLAQLGMDYVWADRPAEAARLMEDALRRAGGRTKARAKLSWVPSRLTEAYEQSGQFDKAEALRREELARARANSGEGEQTAGALATLGLVLLQQRKFAEAEPVLRECVAIREKVLADQWPLFNARSMLGEALLGQRRLAEAEPLLVQGYEGLKAREASIPAQVRSQRLSEAAARVVRLYAALNQRRKADRLLRSEDRDALMPNGIAAFGAPTTRNDSVASP